MSGTAQNAYFRNIPPKTSGTHIVQSNPVDTAAESFDWVTPLGANAPQGTCWLTLEALAQDIYVRFGASATAATTSANGRLIKAGSPGVSFFVSPSKDRFIDHLAASAGGTQKVQVSSPIAEREQI